MTNIDKFENEIFGLAFWYEQIKQIQKLSKKDVCLIKQYVGDFFECIFFATQSKLIVSIGKFLTNGYTCEKFAEDLGLIDDDEIKIAINNMFDYYEKHKIKDVRDKVIAHNVFKFSKIKFDMNHVLKLSEQIFDFCSLCEKKANLSKDELCRTEYKGIISNGDASHLLNLVRLAEKYEHIKSVVAKGGKVHLNPNSFELEEGLLVSYPNV